MAKLQWSDKYLDFLMHQENCEAEFLEGETAAGKTTVGVFKFLAKVALSDETLHFIASKSTGTAEKNIIQADLGIMDLFPTRASYRGNGDAKNKLPHIRFIDDQNREKIIYILGYNNRDTWKSALGSQFGCGFIDEVNTADIEFIRESTMRCKYWMATLNPDDPNLDVYKEYINRARPLKEYVDDTPEEIQEDLAKVEAHPKWTYWFFKMDHNAGLSEERKEQIRNAVPKGTKIYKNKILGLRGRSTGLIFSVFDRNKHLISYKQAKSYHYARFTCGVDTSYSRKSDDTIAFIFEGLTRDGKLITLAEDVYNNLDLAKTGQEVAPSDVAKKLHEFLDKCRQDWGFARRVYVDNADQATILELNKYKTKHGLSYEFLDSDKSVKIIDRVNMINGWLNDENYLIVDTCKNHIDELELHSWQENKDMPEDRNDHTINAMEYGAMSLRTIVGKQNGNDTQYNALLAGFRG